MFRLIRKRLLTNEGTPPDTQYDPDTDTTQTSTDGGLTWNDNPGADPRINPAYLVPPNEEPDVKCAAAAGMRVYMEQIVTAGIDGTTLAGIANVLLSLVLIFLPISWFFALFALAAEALIAIGGAALSFSFSEGIYDQLQCIFYKHVDADGRLDAATILDVQSDVYAIGDATVSAVFDLAYQMAGFVGFNNAGAKLADAGAECACGWCYYAPLPTDESGFVPYILSGTAGNYVPALGWEAVDVTSWGGFNRTLLMGRFIFAETLTVSSIDLHYNWVVGTSSPLTEGLGVYVNDFATNLYSANQNFMTTGDDQTVNINSGIPADITSLDIWMQPAISTPSGSAVMTIVQLRGEGEPPAWLEDMGWIAC